MTRFRWGIFGTGAISAKFVAGLARLTDAQVVLVASRDSARARGFADRFGIADVVGGYDAAALSGRVDAVYIATPPALHRDHACACIAAGIPVLVEKPFASDPASAEAIVAAARAAGVFCMEGMWSRFVPALQRLRALVADGAIGAPRQVAGAFGISNAVDPAFGNFDPARGGGALAHLGVYPVSLGHWLFGPPVAADAIGRTGDTGVDEDVGMTLRYASGVLGSFQASLRSPADGFAVHGTHGTIRLAGPIYRPWGIVREDASPRGAPATEPSRGDMARESHGRQRIGQLRAAYGRGPGTVERHFFDGNGYHYEAAEVAACVRAGRTESAVMPLDDSLGVMATLDGLRARVMRGQA